MKLFGIIFFVLALTGIFIFVFIHSQNVQPEPKTGFGLELESADHEFIVGKCVSLRFKLTNHDVADAEVAALMMSRQSIVLEIREGKRVWRIDRIWPQEPEKVKLESGKSLEMFFELPLLRAGNFTFKALYYGLEKNAKGVKADPAQPLESAELSAKVIKIKNMDEAVLQLNTEYGKIILGFDTKNTMATSVNLAWLAHTGFYKTSAFHRAIPGFVIQGGSKNGDGNGGPGYVIPLESRKNKHVKGALSMAHEDSPDTANSQFFIVHDKADHLDTTYQFCSFGKLLAGEDTVDSIAKADSMLDDKGKATGILQKPVKILSAKILPWDEKNRLVYE